MSLEEDDREKMRHAEEFYADHFSDWESVKKANGIVEAIVDEMFRYAEIIVSKAKEKEGKEE